MLGIVLGKKGKTTQMFDETGNRIPVTAIDLASYSWVGTKRADIDGYDALILACGVTKSVKKPQAEFQKKSGAKTPLSYMKEVRLSAIDGAELITEGKKTILKLDEEHSIELGKEIDPALAFVANQKITVQGTSKGKGFQGVVKRHGFAGGPATHGQSNRLRAPGSIGMSATPGRVLKGKRMAGRMGTETISIKNLSIVDMTPTEVRVRGLIPGSKGSFVVIRQA